MNYISSVIPFVPILPLIGAIIIGLFGKRIQAKFGENGVGIFGCATPLLSAILAYSSFFVLIGQSSTERVVTMPLFKWFSAGSLKVHWTFTYDPLSALMLLIITGIGFLIHVYSMGYMHGDKSVWRFFSYINLFTASMLLLVLGDNIVVMFLGWEGVGLCSYLLIGFWFSDIENAKAGKKAFITNRIGDLGFVIGIFLIFMYTSDKFSLVNLSFGEMAQRIDFLSQQSIWGFPLLEVIAFCFFIGAMGKSAQIPLYVWLPDAMAGPTPVSALIHAATMVTAGVYMIARMNFLYTLAPNVLGFVAIIAALTCFFSATIGMAQFDIKKVLAYSTVSQLGYMFLAMGVGAYSAGVFHLLTHAAFKAALFMGSGSVIIGMHHEQDMRKMGGLFKKMPITAISFIAATFAIMGFPTTSGFFSKDEILWKAWIQGSPMLWAVGFTAAGITSFYMWRLVFMTFFGESRADQETWDHCHEQPKRTVVPIAILAIAAILIGWLNVPHFLGGHSNFTNYLSPIVHDLEKAPLENFHELQAIKQQQTVAAAPHEDHTAMEWTLMLASIAWTFFTAFLAYYFYMVNPKLREKLAMGYTGQSIFKLLHNKYFVDELYEGVILDPIRRLYIFLSNFDAKVVDGIVNGAGEWSKRISNATGLFDGQVIDGTVNATAWVSQGSGGWFQKLQSGRLQTLVAGSAVIFVLIILVIIP